MTQSFVWLYEGVVNITASILVVCFEQNLKIFGID
jgi:hypothetical protein